MDIDGDFVSREESTWRPFFIILMAGKFSGYWNRICSALVLYLVQSLIEEEEEEEEE